MTRFQTHFRHGHLGRLLIAALAIAALVPAAALASSPYKTASGSARSGLLKAFAAADGSSAEAKGVYVSSTNSSLGVVCNKTPEAGYRAYVFAKSNGHWRLAALGVPGHAGNSADRQLERACP